MKVSREFRFEASHILPRHEGKCSRLHGHSWRVRVTIYGWLNRENGFVLDFARLKAIVQPLIDRLDHRHLNNFVVYPSSENISIHLAHAIRARFAYLYPAFRYSRLLVEVSETANTWAVWDSNEEADRLELNFICGNEGWLAPKVNTGIDNVPAALAQAQQLAKEKFDDWQKTMTQCEQLSLYMDSIDSNPVLPDFKAAKEAEQEIAANGKEHS